VNELIFGWDDGTVGTVDVPPLGLVEINIYQSPLLPRLPCLRGELIQEIKREDLGNNNTGLIPATYTNI